MSAKINVSGCDVSLSARAPISERCRSLSTRERQALEARDHHIVGILSYVDVFLDKPTYDTYIRMRLKSESYFCG